MGRTNRHMHNMKHYCYRKVRSILLLAVILSLQVGANVEDKSHCQLEHPYMTPEMAQLGHQRRKHATVVLSTELDDGMGLVNQHSAVLSLLALGLVARVDRIILPKHLHRDRFALYASVWKEGAPEEIWDVKSITQFLQARGVDTQVRLRIVAAYFPSSAMDGALRLHTRAAYEMPREEAIETECTLSLKARNENKKDWFYCCADKATDGLSTHHHRLPIRHKTHTRHRRCCAYFDAANFFHFGTCKRDADKAQASYNSKAVALCLPHK